MRETTPGPVQSPCVPAKLRSVDLAGPRIEVQFTRGRFGLVREIRSAFIQASSIINSKVGGVPYIPNQRARREEQKFSLSIRNPTEGA